MESVIDGVRKISDGGSFDYYCQISTVCKDSGKYRIKGQGVSTFVVQHHGVVTHSHNFLVVAHSSYDAKMHAANTAIDYIAHNIQGLVLVFIDNQAMLKSLFSTKPHTTSHYLIAKVSVLGCSLPQTMP